jgi:hypothetical protein
MDRKVTIIFGGNKMKGKMNKALQFIKDHKAGIIAGGITAAAAVGGIVLVAIGKKKSGVITEFSGVFSTPSARDIPVADWSVGTLDECWRESGWINLIARGFTVADAGKFGEELLKIEGVTADTELQTVMSFEDIVKT